MLYRINTAKVQTPVGGSLLPPDLLPPFKSIEALLSAVYAEGYSDSAFNNSPDTRRRHRRQPQALTIEVHMEESTNSRSSWVPLATRLFSLPRLRTMLATMGLRAIGFAAATAAIEEEVETVIEGLNLQSTKRGVGPFGPSGL